MEINEEQKIYKVQEKVDNTGKTVINIEKKNENESIAIIYDYKDKYTLDLGKGYDKFLIEYNRERKKWSETTDYHSADYYSFDKSSFTLAINDIKLAQAFGLEKRGKLQANICLSANDENNVIGNDINIVMRYMVALDYFMSTAHKTIYGVDSPKKIKQNPVGDRIYNEIITAFSNKIKSFFSEDGVENLANAEDAQQFLDNQFKEHDLSNPLYSINQVQKSIVDQYLETRQANDQRQEKIDSIIKSSIFENRNQKSFLANVFTNLAAKLKSYGYYRLVKREVMKRLKEQGIKMRRSEVQEAVQKAVQEAARKADDLERNN